MPLIKSKSPAAFKENVRTLMGEVSKSPHVKSREQALAIAYATQRRGKRKGGRTHFQIGGFANPAAAPVSGPAMPTGGFAPTPSPVAAMPQPAMVSPPSGPTSPMPSPVQHGGFGGMGGIPQGMPSNALGLGQWPSQQGGLNWFNSAPGMQGLSGSMAGPQASKDGGGIKGYQLGGAPQMPWFAKQEARSLTHVGPVNSIVPGRTDRHSISVPSGSYVLPAATISHLGQSNTNAGMAVAHRMFGSGPLGTPAPKMGRGIGLPKPPKPMGIPSDRGGARGHDAGTPTPVVVAGGEYIIHPAKVAEIGGGSVENGHKILDEFVKRIHKKHAKEIANLPPPANS